MRVFHIVTPIAHTRVRGTCIHEAPDSQGVRVMDVVNGREVPVAAVLPNGAVVFRRDDELNKPDCEVDCTE